MNLYIHPFQEMITLGVAGSIGAYKAADLAAKLTQAEAQIDVIFYQIKKSLQEHYGDQIGNNRSDALFVSLI